MRAGVIASVIAHVGAILIIQFMNEFTPAPPPISRAVVPIDIVSVSDVTNVRALALPEDQTTETPSTANEPQQQQAALEPAPSPTPTPTRQRNQRNAASQQDDLLRDLTRRDDRQQRTNGAPSTRAQQGSGPGTGDTATLQDRIIALTQAAMLRCWRMPADLPNPERLVVNVEWELDRNGHLRGQPRVIDPPTFDPAMQQARAAALRAVRACDPYPFPDDSVVGERYDLWRNGSFRFAVRTQ